jgi:hypothetical protein
MGEIQKQNQCIVYKEITKLKTLFPQNIKQFSVYYEGAIVAGLTLFK